MKAASIKKLREAIDQIHQMESWEMLGEACPLILDNLLGADFSSWNVFDQGGALVEVFGTPQYASTMQYLIEDLNEHMGEHPVIQNTTLSSGKVLSETLKLSDFTSQRDFENTGLYHQAYRHLDARYQTCAQIMIFGGLEVVVSANRSSRDFGDESLALLSSLKKHLAISCRRLLREQELKERVSLLMASHTPVALASISVDQRGRVIEASNNIAAFFASHFHCVEKNLPGALRSFLAKRQLSMHACGETCELLDDHGDPLTITLLQTGFGTRWTLLFHQPEAIGAVPIESAVTNVKSLTIREKEVLQWLSEGKSNPEISILLNISLRTIEKHCEHIYEKLGVENRMAATREWLES
ncbi:MAG: helix-turn-helix transcriptional regulator [Verrucomicrobiales bacterium]|nr:helix-turn-helix transcriptional regulator [Verrucomicrobiales bacterium]